MNGMQVSIFDLPTMSLCKHCEHYIPFTVHDSQRPGGWWNRGQCRLRMREDPLGYTEGDSTCPDCVPDSISIDISHTDQRWLENLRIDELDDQYVQRELDRIAAGRR